MAPTISKQWHVSGKGGFQDLKFTEDKIPQVRDREVLVKWHYASLNYRDLIISKGEYPFAQKDNVIPGSDGAGEVVSVGSTVSLFKPGDRVSAIFTQAHLSGPIAPSMLGTGVGGALDGVLQEYGVFPETGLVLIPKNLDYQQASTLPCAAVTAWNALYGVTGKRLMPGQWVLTQGTGGVSVFGLQFAKAAGARVIATSSSAEKCNTLKKLGADHVINYKENPNWGEEAKKITGGIGVDQIIEVGGANTLKQSLAAIRLEGLITIIGFLSGVESKDQPTLLNCLMSLCTVRGCMVGSREQFEEMNAAIEANNIKPVVDKQVFELKDLQEAYQYMWDQKHFGKLTVKIA